jgi:hypothetical protein
VTWTIFLALALIAGSGLYLSTAARVKKFCKTRSTIELKTN